MAHETFRAGAGAVIVDARGRVLVFDRADVPEPAWQLPQGGLEPGEEPEAAVLREVEEETGITKDELQCLGRVSEPLAYELPPALRSAHHGRGQVGYWFFLLLAPGSEPRLPERGEFRAWKRSDFDALVDAVVAFRRPVYRRLAQHFDSEIRPRLPGGGGRS